MTADKFRIKTFRCEWAVVVQPVDLSGRDCGIPTVLTVWPTHELAVADLPNHGRQHECVSTRWVPLDENYDPEFTRIRIQCREVDISESTDLR
jgi:hypothetical protein